jgi:Transposase
MLAARSPERKFGTPVPGQLWTKYTTLHVGGSKSDDERECRVSDCVETRHMQAVLKAQINKTDRNDARGIAQMMRVGLYRPVHVKTLRSQKLRMLLTHRKLLSWAAIRAHDARLYQPLGILCPIARAASGMFRSALSVAVILAGSFNAWHELRLPVFA